MDKHRHQISSIDSLQVELDILANEISNLKDEIDIIRKMVKKMHSQIFRD